MTIATLAVRFLVEVIGIGAVAYWGFQAVDGFGRIALGIGAAVAFIVLWSLVIAPKATNPLTQPQRDLIGTAQLLLAAGALAAAGQPGLAVAFAAVVLVDWLILVVLGPSAVDAVRPSAARVR
jgi:hypothetical protein